MCFGWRYRPRDGARFREGDHRILKVAGRVVQVVQVALSPTRWSTIPGGDHRILKVAGRVVYVFRVALSPTKWSTVPGGDHRILKVAGRMV